MKYRLNVLILGLSVWIWGVSLSAQQLSNLYQTAVSRNESMAVQRGKIQEAQARYEGVLSALQKPYVGLIGSQKVQGDDATVPDYKVSAKHPLYVGQKDQDNLAALKTLVVKETWRLGQIKRDLALKISEAYFTILQLSKQIENIHVIQELAQDRLVDLKERVRLGKSKSSDLLSSEAQYLGFKAEETLLQGQLTAAVLQLESVVGVALPGFKAVDVTYVYAPSPYDIATRSDLKATQADILYLTQLEQAAQHALQPSLGIGANYYFKRTEALGHTNWDVTLTGEWPLYNPSFEPEVTVAKSQLKQLQDLYAQQLRDMQTEIKVDETLLKAALARRDIMEKSVQKLKQSYDFIQRDYRLGLSSNMDVLATLKTYLDGKTELDKAIITCQSYALQLKLDKEESL